MSKSILSFFLIGMMAVSPLFALEQTDRFYSLKPEPAPQPKILGIGIADSPNKIIATLASMGMTIDKREIQGENGELKVLFFNGLPDGLPLKKGRSKVVFLDERLIHFELTFEPSYENFLLVRSQLFTTLGERFALDEKKEYMDEKLKAYLANLQKGEYGESSEKEVTRGLLAGTTLFMYDIKDKKEEIEAKYGYYPDIAMNGKITPKLQLQFTLKKEMDAYKQRTEGKKEAEAKKPTILPQQ
jgi:hypothetical protein